MDVMMFNKEHNAVNYMAYLSMNAENLVISRQNKLAYVLQLVVVLRWQHFLAP